VAGLRMTFVEDFLNVFYFKANKNTHPEFQDVNKLKKELKKMRTLMNDK